MSSLFRTPGHPPSAWLNKRVTVDEAENALRAEAREFNFPIATKWLQQWAEFKDILEDNDELWYFEHFPEPLSGAAGYCIVRRGSSVASITTKRA